ncbi:MAG: hypothetical protein IM638_13945 [Bacteroidetes bacterium]|nr:hypothetical protein [Bacteroidota bacterium]
MSTTTLPTKPSGQFNGMLTSFSKVGLLMQTGAVTSVIYGQNISLTLDQNTTVPCIDTGVNFSFTVNTLPPITLFLDQDGKVKLRSDSKWKKGPEPGNRFMYVSQGNSLKDFSVHILLSTASNTEIMEIILVGTVPTEDDKR